MPDFFFASFKPRKRKRADSTGGPPTHGKKFARKGSNISRDTKKKHGGKVNGVQKTSKSHGRAADEELSDQTDEGEGDIDDMDLRADVDLDDHVSGEEDEDETPAEKRLRLAKLHLENVKMGLGEIFNCVFLVTFLLTLRIS